MVRALMGSKGRPVSQALLDYVAKVEIPHHAAAPDLIISSGGKSVFSAKNLAERFGVPYVFIGERKPFPARWFTTVISPVPEESSENSIDVELIPTPVNPRMIAEMGPEQPELWCMVIGGASRSHQFTTEDWIALARGVNQLAERYQRRWLLTTSRRTGTTVETILRQYLNPKIIADAIWWAEQPRKELYQFMARAEKLFITQDSVTMVTEAISAGKPVYSVYPKQLRFSNKSFLPDYYSRLESNHRLKRVPLSKLESLDIGNDKFDLMVEDCFSSVAFELASKLKLI